MKRLSLALVVCLPILFVLYMSTASASDLPRNMALKAFDPHRPDFQCLHEADHVPPIDPVAEAWFQEGLRVTSRDLWPNQRDYPKAVALWTKAAEHKHWKAMINLASVLIEGDGTAPYVVPRDEERAVRIVEDAMRLGIPESFDLMGTFHQKGLGVKGDVSRAYAFWELAADKGSAAAQAYLGKKLNATYDSPGEGFWGNKVVGIKMLECSFSQGNGNAAFQLGLTLRLGRNYSRALAVLHEGVKMGSEASANSLRAIFSGADFAKGGPAIDDARQERYDILGDVLYRNPDLRFPNLDKILPLPPSELPVWNGEKQTLIDAAKGIVQKPVAPSSPMPNPAALRTGRAFIPENKVLPERPALQVASQYETTAASESGYWIARLLFPRTERHAAWDAAQVPIRYEKGELFDRTRPGLEPEDGRIMFHYLGQPIPRPPVAAEHEHPLVARRLARYATFREPLLRRRGSVPSPQTGVWSAKVPDDHLMAAVFNDWKNQSYVGKGESFPDPKARCLDIEPRDVIWTWLGNANKMRPDGVSLVTLNAVDVVGDEA